MGLLARLFGSTSSVPTAPAKKNVHLFSVSNPGQPIWSMPEYNYDKLVKEGYAKNPYVYAAIRLVSTALGSIPWVLYDGSKDRNEIADHEILRLIKRPNPYCGQAKFFEQFVTSMMISGACYIQRVGPDGNKPPAELWNLRPDLVKPTAGDNVKPVKNYVYDIGAGKTQTIDPEYILQLKFYHPLSAYTGLSPLMVAAMAIDQSNASKSWNVALLQNGGKPAGAFSTEADLNEPEYNRLKDQIKDQTSGTSVGKPLLLEGGLKYTQMSFSATDMDWLEGQKLSAREISVVFGVPPELLGDSSNKTYANYGEARKAFYEETVIPMAQWIRDEFNTWLVPLFNPKYELDIDTDAIDALAEDQDKKYSRVGAADWLTINEKRAATGYDDIQGGDTILIPFSLTPLGAATDPDEAPPEGGSDSEDDSDGEDDAEEVKKKEGKAFGLTTAEAKTEYWKLVDRKRMRATEASVPLVKKILKDDFKAVANAIRNCASPAGFEPAIKSVLDGRRSAWQEGYLKLYVTVGNEFAKSVYAGLKSKASYQMKAEILDQRWLDGIKGWVQRYADNKIKGILDTTAKQIRGELSTGIAEGEGIPELAKRIDAFGLPSSVNGHIIPNRSELIARTEVISASNLGSQEAARSTGMALKKEWISTYDDRTRDDHKVKIESVGIDEPYTVAGEQLMFPGDTSLNASPENTINCRCSEGYFSE